MFEQGFPLELNNVFHKVLGLISMKTYNNVYINTASDAPED